MSQQVISPAKASVALYYLSNSLYNQVSLVLLNNSGIFHNNENKILFQVESRQILAQAQRLRKNYLFKRLNLFDRAVNLLWVDDQM